MTELYTVGVVVGPHGLRGELKVFSRTDFPELRFVKGAKLTLASDEGQSVLLTVKAARPHKNMYLVTFLGYESLEAVQGFKGRRLVVTADQLAPLPEGEFFYHQLVGCSVYGDDGEFLGTLTEVLTPGANDVYVVQRPAGKDILLPAIHDCILRVDPAAKRMDVHILPGLLD